MLILGLVAIMPVFIIWLYIIYGGKFYLDEEYAYDTWNKKFCQTDHQGSVDVLFLGDSVVNASVLPENLSESTYNISLGGRTSAEAYYILKEYLENNTAPKVCYIGFADIGYIADTSLYTRTLYFHRLSYEDEQELFANAISYNVEDILKENYEEEWMQYHYWSPYKYLPALFNGGFFLRYGDYKANMDLIDSHNGSYMAYTEEIFSPTETLEYTAFRPGDFYDFYMKKILDTCVENDITPRVIMIPMSPNIECTMDYIADCYKYLVELQTYCPSMTYLYRPDGFDSNDFGDEWHMNHNGAIKYTAVLKETYPEDFE